MSEKFEVQGKMLEKMSNGVSEKCFEVFWEIFFLIF